MTSSLSLRFAAPGDARALARLAQVDSTRRMRPARRPLALRPALGS